jgi:undecaprenyl-diphosphatase
LSASEAFLLGLVQGLTEFFPVSSSGHLVIFQKLLGLDVGAGLVFEISVHVATLVAIAIYYRSRIVDLVVGAAKREGAAWIYIGKLAFGTLPAVGVALSGRHFIEQQFSKPEVVGVALLVTGTILWTTRWTVRSAHATDPTWIMALLVGCAQAFAIMPGISRSGTTVAVALALGLAPAAAAEFSFLLGIVAIAGAAVLMLSDVTSASPELLGSVAIGCTSALVSGMAAIWLFVRMLKRQAFHHFAWYAWAAGAAFLAWLQLEV